VPPAEPGGLTAVALETPVDDLVAEVLEVVLDWPALVWPAAAPAAEVAGPAGPAGMVLDPGRGEVVDGEPVVEGAVGAGKGATAEVPWKATTCWAAATNR
jgi:hypothetical protein